MIHTQATGRLTQKPKLTTTRNNKAMCMSSIKCNATSFNDTRPLFITYSLIAFKEKAEKLAQYNAGDLITIYGELSLNEWQKEGKQFSNHQVLVESITDDIPAQETLI